MPRRRLCYGPRAASPILADPGFQERHRRDEWYDELIAKRRVLDILDAVDRSLNNAISIQRTEGAVKFVFDASELPWRALSAVMAAVLAAVTPNGTRPFAISSRPGR